jgi:hypothetical protein
MSDNSVKSAWEVYREASQRFEYFILGVSVALVAYAGKTLEPEKLGLTPYTLEVAAVFLLIASVVLGFKRVEQIIHVHSANVRLISFQERRGSMAKAFFEGRDQIIPHTGELWKPADMKKEIEELDRVIPILDQQINETNSKLSTLYGWRNWLLVCGFLFFFFAKVLTPYCR